MAAQIPTTQKGSPIRIEHPFDHHDDLILRRISVQEGLSELFTIEAHVVSLQNNLKFEKIVGHEVGFTLEFGEDDRYFHGVVGSFLQYATSESNAKSKSKSDVLHNNLRMDKHETKSESDIYTHLHSEHDVTWYEIKVYPKLWLLTLSSDCRIFQNETPLDIIQKILDEHDISDVEIKATKCGQDVREYCVQYNETHFDFISRLMEEEGIFYFFKQEKGKHTLIIADSDTHFEDCVGSEELAYDDATPDIPELNAITQCDLGEVVAPLSFSSSDYNMTNSSAKLYSQSKSTSENNTLQGHQYAYPGQIDHENIPTQDRLEALMRIRLEEQQALKKNIYVKSTAPYLFAGGQFKLTDHHRHDMNAKKYVLKWIFHEIQAVIDDNPSQSVAEASDNYYVYRNEFQAFNRDIPYRSPRKTKSPKIESIQSAVVTGPEGEEIFTDEYGRVKIQFKWDRQWAEDDKSSCWVRVQQGWAGNNWGMIFTPRIGMEVMVSFLDGNPSCPVITGCLYNSDHMPPYLEERITSEMTPTKSGIKTRSSKGGEDAFNELRFEDKTGEEQLYIRAQKDYDTYIIENETKHIEKGSQWVFVDQGDRNVILKGGGEAVAKTTPDGQDLPAGAGDDILELSTGSRYTTFMSGNGPIRDTTYIKEGLTEYQNDKGGMSRIFQDGNDRKTIVKGNREVVLKEGDDFHKVLKGNRKSVIETGNRTHEIVTGDDKTYIHTGNDLSYIKEGNQKLQIDAGNIGIQIDEGSKVTKLKAGDYKLNIDKGNQELTLTAGDVVLTISKGDQKEDITGKYEGKYSDEYKLTVSGKIAITCEDKVEITASGDISMSSEGDIKIDAGGDFKVTATGDISMDATGDLKTSSTGGTTIQSTQDASLKSDMAVAVESGMDLDLTGGIGLNLKSTANLVVDAGAQLELKDLAGNTIKSSAMLSIEGTAVTMKGSMVSIST